MTTNAHAGLSLVVVLVLLLAAFGGQAIVLPAALIAFVAGYLTRETED
jgi:Kef-type K+ transport system membrane component KefB